MACLKVSKGTVTIQHGIDSESHEPMLVISSAASTKVTLGAGHNYPIPMSEGELRFLERDLSEEARKALRLVMSEVELKILEKAKKKAQDFSEKTGIKLDA